MAEDRSPRSAPEPSVALFDLFEDEDDGYGSGMLVDARFELMERLGAGGMGSVWSAHDHLLDVDVALKIVRADKLQIVGRERLIREARATAAIHHPAVVAVHGFGICDGAGYIAMERLEGRTLEQILDDEGALSAVGAVRLMIPIVDALAAAHAKGVIHRDVKPGNIMVVDAPDGTRQPKLLDFGIAHQRRQASRGRLTVTGQVLGTPCYMSYEQAAGKKEIDHRADVWSLCCVIYELVAGVGPFDGDNYNAVLRAVLMDPPVPLPDVASDVDEELWRIIERGLAKPAAKRWPSMKALGLALRRWLLEQGHRTDATGRSLITSDFTDLAGDLPPPRPAPRPAPRTPTLAMTFGELRTADDPGPPPSALAVSMRPPTRPRRHLGAIGGALALIALPVAAMGHRSTPAQVDAIEPALSLFAAGVVPDGRVDPEAPEVTTTPPATTIEEVTQEEAPDVERDGARTPAPDEATARPPRRAVASPPPWAPTASSTERPTLGEHASGRGSRLPLPATPRFR